MDKPQNKDYIPSIEDTDEYKQGLIKPIVDDENYIPSIEDTDEYKQGLIKSIKDQEQPKIPPSKLESLLRGAVAGGSSEFSDELMGAVAQPQGALLKAFGASELDPKVMEYIQARDAERQKQEAAYQENPYTYRAGQAVGTIAQALLPMGQIGTAKNILKAPSIIGAGLEAGALSGAASLGASEELSTDSAKQAAKDALLGGVVGAGANKVFNVKNAQDLLSTIGTTAAAGSAADVLVNPDKDILEAAKEGAVLGAGAGTAAMLGRGALQFLKDREITKVAKKAYEEGLEGKDYLNRAARDEQVQKASKDITDLYQDLTTNLKSKGKEIDTTITQSTKDGVKIDTQELLNKYNKLISELEPASSSQERQLNQIKDILHRQQGETSPVKLKNLLGVIDDQMSSGDPSTRISDPSLGEIVKNFRKDLHTQLIDNVPNLEKVNKEYSNLKAAAKVSGLDIGNDKDIMNLELGKIRDQAMKTVKEGSVQQKKLTDIQKDLEASLQQTNPELSNKILETYKQVGEDSITPSAIRSISEGFSYGSTAKTGAATLGQFAGLAASPLKEAANVVPSKISNALQKKLYKDTSVDDVLNYIKQINLTKNTNVGDITQKVKLKKLVNLENIKPTGIKTPHYTYLPTTTPDDYINSIDDTEEGASELKEKLNIIKQQDPAKQKSMMFALSQNPKYGPLLRKAKK